MDKISIKIKLSSKEWTGLTALVLQESVKLKNIDDRYFRSLMEPLMMEVYKKLHNKLHSLKESKNTLSLTIPEGAAFNLTFADEDYFAPNEYANMILNVVVSQIDKRLA